MKENMACLNLSVADQEGAMERLLGRVRRRGFRIERMLVTAASPEEIYRIDLTVTGNRCFEKLAKQLLTIHDVKSVWLRTTSSPMVFAPEYASVNSVPVPVG